MLGMTKSSTPPQAHNATARRFEVEDFASLSDHEQRRSLGLHLTGSQITPAHLLHVVAHFKGVVFVQLALVLGLVWLWQKGKSLTLSHLLALALALVGFGQNTNY
jgi:hypothetical protein